MRCRRMQEHAWQGNVRELNHVVERAVLMAQSNCIKAGDLALRSGSVQLATAGRDESGRRGRVPHQESAGDDTGVMSAMRPARWD